MTPSALLQASSLRLSVCVSHLRKEGFALPPQDGYLIAGDQPDDPVVGVPILVGELVAEVQDAPSVGQA